MNIATDITRSSRARIPARLASVGLIVPSGNRMSEIQFNYFAPPGLSIHASRARIAGRPKRSIAEMKDEIETAARLAGDCRPDLIVFHCTNTALQEGREGEARIMSMVAEASNRPTVSTSALIMEAMQVLGITRPVLLTPYGDNANALSYFAEYGTPVLHDVALGLQGPAYETVSVERWVELARENDRPDADGIVLGCTATLQIEAIALIEEALGKPVVNSNQAVLWGCMKRLQDKLSPLAPMPQLGRLMNTLNS